MQMCGCLFAKHCIADLVDDSGYETLAWKFLQSLPDFPLKFKSHNSFLAGRSLLKLMRYTADDTELELPPYLVTQLQGEAQAEGPGSKPKLEAFLDVLEPWHSFKTLCESTCDFMEPRFAKNKESTILSIHALYSSIDKVHPRFSSHSISDISLLAAGMLAASLAAHCVC